jgi:hypothetical protein
MLSVLVFKVKAQQLGKNHTNKPLSNQQPTNKTTNKAYKHFIVALKKKKHPPIPSPPPSLTPLLKQYAHSHIHI